MFSVKNRSQIATSTARIEGSHRHLNYRARLYRLSAQLIAQKSASFSAIRSPIHRKALHTANASQRVILNVLLMLGSLSLLSCLHFENLKRTLSSSLQPECRLGKSWLFRGALIFCLYSSEHENCSIQESFCCFFNVGTLQPKIQMSFSQLRISMSAECFAGLTLHAAKARGRDHEELCAVRE